MQYGLIVLVLFACLYNLYHIIFRPRLSLPILFVGAQEVMVVYVNLLECIACFFSVSVVLLGSGNCAWKYFFYLSLSYYYNIDILSICCFNHHCHAISWSECVVMYYCNDAVVTSCLQMYCHSHVKQSFGPMVKSLFLRGNHQ